MRRFRTHPGQDPVAARTLVTSLTLCRRMTLATWSLQLIYSIGFPLSVGGPPNSIVPEVVIGASARRIESLTLRRRCRRTTPVMESIRFFPW